MYSAEDRENMMLRPKKVRLVPVSVGLLITISALLALSVMREREGLRITEAEIDAAVERGLTFLNSLYDPEYLFDDLYIREGPVLYRKLDMAIVLKFFLPEEHKNDPLMAQIMPDSENLVSTLLEEWKTTPLEGLPLSSDPPIDLYAVFAYYYPDETEFMLDQLLANLSCLLCHPCL
jgi:hypothetical protein